jgi:hypothetical protein
MLKDVKIDVIAESEARKGGGFHGMRANVKNGDVHFSVELVDIHPSRFKIGGEISLDSMFFEALLAFEEMAFEDMEKKSLLGH